MAIHIPEGTGARSLVLGFLIWSASSTAATFTVNTTADTNDATPGDGLCADTGGACSLRAAIEETNALPGADIVKIPAGTYVLTLAGAGDDASATGDLDITDDLTISGKDAASTVIDGNNSDRVIHIPSSTTVEISRVTIQGGNPPTGCTGCTRNGGGILNHGNLRVLDTTISGNTSNNGSGIDNWGTLSVEFSVIDSNTGAPYGGGIRNTAAANLTVTNSIISNNIVGENGGGIANDGITSITTSIITGNSTTGNLRRGGGIANAIGGTMTIHDSTISANTATSNGKAGAVSNEGVLTILRSTISDNATSGSGNIMNTGTLTISNTTISGNSATGDNGGILNEGGTTTITNTTFSGNSGNTTADLCPSAGTINVSNTIIANQVSGPGCNPGACWKGKLNISNSLDSDGSCGAGITADPLLSPLQDNGGWTQTHALQAGSPALDAGDATVCANAPVDGMDQRGFTRPYGGGCDIGAYEDMPLYQLSLTVAGTGSGHVISSPGNINCQSGTCNAKIGVNTQITLTAIADDDSMFTGWSGDCTTNEVHEGVVTVDADKSCTATFEPIQHTLTVVTNPAGMGTVTGVVNYGTSSVSTVIDCGADCTETLPGSSGVISLVSGGFATGWGFTGWSGCDQVDGVWCHMTLDADKTLTANFGAADIGIDDGTEPTGDLKTLFGDVVVGSTVTAIVTIHSEGQVDLDEIWVEDQDPLAAPFGLIDNCSDISLAPGQSCSFTVSFTPTAAGTFSDTFDIISEDPDEPSLTLTVSGNGIAPPAPAIGGSGNLVFGTLREGESDEQVFSVTNNGAAPLVIGSVGGNDSLAAPFSLVNDNCSGQTLAPGAGCTLTVRFAPGSEGSYSDSFDIASNDPGTPSLIVRVSGNSAIPLATAETGFRLVGSGGGGGGASGPLELLLGLIALAFRAGRRHPGRTPLTLLCAGLLALVIAIPASAEEGPYWYFGGSSGWAHSDFSEGQLESHLTAAGYEGNSVSVNQDGTAWKMFGGYRFNSTWALEAAWTDLGEVGSTVQGTVDDSQIPALLDTAAEGHGYLARGLNIAGVAALPLDKGFTPFLKLGLYRWWAEVKVKEEMSGQSHRLSHAGTDLMGGIGIAYQPHARWDVRAEYEYFRVGSYRAGFLSLGVDYRF